MLKKRYYSKDETPSVHGQDLLRSKLSIHATARLAFCCAELETELPLFVSEGTVYHTRHTQ